MIRYLKINHFILVDHCEIDFDKGLTIITGESGSGKSAMIEAIHLLLGGKTDHQLIRDGAEKAYLEAAFDLNFSASIINLFKESEIDFEKNEFLLISREIVREGKSRSFINRQMVSSAFLQKIGSQLIDIVDQQSSFTLRSGEKLLELLDIYADSEEELKAFQNALIQENAIKEELQKLLSQNINREKDLEFFSHQLAEIEEAAIKEGEEEEVFREYSLLTSSQEIAGKAEAMLSTLQDILPKISHFKIHCDELSNAHQSFQDCAQLFKEALISLQECERMLPEILSKIEEDPKRLDFLEKRLQIISKIKKKYGTTFELQTFYRNELISKIKLLEELEEKITERSSRYSEQQSITSLYAKKLSEKRAFFAQKFIKELTQEVQDLNMQDAQVLIEMKQKTRTFSGEDEAIFFLQSNPGEKPVPVKESSSGGELARLLLAIKLVLAEKNKVPTLVFDEIDSSVGGKTASLIGKKLQHLGKTRQVLCITHFPQVASFADLHLRIYKKQRENRTVTLLEKLSKEEQKEELLRMLGGEEISLAKQENFKKVNL